MSTDTTNTHAELKKLYCQDWIETNQPWERWEVLYEKHHSWFPVGGHPVWHTDAQYRRIDPYRALKEALAQPEPEQRILPGAGAFPIRVIEPSIPEGWKLVPIEPTEKMIIAAAVTRATGKDNSYSVYKAMLAAAPEYKETLK